MARPIPSYLRIHRHETARPSSGAKALFPGLSSASAALVEAFGCHLEYRDGSAGDGYAVVDLDGKTTGRLLVKPVLNDSDFAPPREVAQIAGAMAEMMSEVQRLRTGMIRVEAELAANIPVSAVQSKNHIADKLQAVMRGALENVHASAAAIYMLDDSTSELKLRAALNLPPERFLEPARPLAAAIADLEALAGNAVVLEDTALLPHWRCPENYPSACCIPVSTSTNPIGTLWIFSEEYRDFTTAETQTLEIIAGRIASELELDVLLKDKTDSHDLTNQLAAIAAQQDHQLPHVKPLLEGWDLAGWTEQAEQAGGDFHDWSMLDDGALAITVGDSDGRQMEAAMMAGQLASAVKSHGRYAPDARTLVNRVNHTFWSTSAGDRFASLAYGVIHPDTGLIEIANAGETCGLLITPDGWEELWEMSFLLGARTDVDPRFLERRLKPGSAITMMSSGVREYLFDEAGPAGIAQFAEKLREHLELPADRILTAGRELLAKLHRPTACDRTIFVVKRRPDR
ncbi:PP2C family protein-serine/threonine phosphatase [Blastopirellula marina]|uniref:PP2C family protein-serine/threonine phosphatase n=1 Tax=Blastopirellula marina TaxID=124 RepID=UPI00058F1F97|nr:GAF domain-containing SpoIIE family protein phosphatase [Blastopirellula marina]